MLAPIEKQRMGGNNIIQVVVTRTCNESCSNCSQLLEFRQDVREMSLDCIEETLQGLQGWPGTISMFGGNVATYSKFKELCLLWKKYIPNQKQRGLWVNNLMKYGQECKDTFWPHGHFNLNVHGDKKAAAAMRKWLPGIPIYGETGEVHHAAMLMDYRDYGYSEQEWFRMRENCDIGLKWSAGVYQGSDGHPYAYFCEVAGSLIGVLTGKHEEVGIPATSGWWKLPMSDFQHQVDKCCNSGCGVPLRSKGHRDTEDTYDISPKWVDLTNKTTGRVIVQVHKEIPGRVHENTDYCNHRGPKNK